MVNITSLILQNIDLFTPEEMSLGCQLVGSLPSLSALTFNDCALRGDYDPRLLGVLSVIQSLFFCQCWETGETFSSPPNDQLSIPWRVRSLSLDDWQGPMDFLHRNPTSLNLVTRFTFRSTGMRFTFLPEAARTLLDHVKENLEELEIADRECSEGPKPTESFPSCPLVKVLTFYINSAPSYFRAVVSHNNNTRVLQELRILVGLFDALNMEETFLGIKQPLENVRSLILSEHIPKVVLKVHRCNTSPGFTEEAFQKKMWECLSVHGELRGVDIQWERFYWRDCDCWDEDTTLSEWTRKGLRNRGS
ncbi:uncharacterized protein STEHIDRAFT_173049, partial [Stereum hirsutum FP-91666 SS1]